MKHQKSNENSKESRNSKGFKIDGSSNLSKIHMNSRLEREIPKV
jgi:hypothetical protein